MTNYTDQEIIINLKNRDNQVVAYLVKKYLPMIKFLIRELRSESTEAEDLFQDALVIIIKKIDTGEFRLTAKFSTYLYAVCKNLLIYHEKRNAVKQKYLIAQANDLMEDENFSERYDDDYQYKLYEHYFSKLGTSCQDILKMYWLDLPVKEIAEKIGSTEGFVRKKKYDCKKRLIELIISNPDNINSD